MRCKSVLDSKTFLSYILTALACISLLQLPRLHTVESNRRPGQRGDLRLEVALVATRPGHINFLVIPVELVVVLVEALADTGYVSFSKVLRGLAPFCRRLRCECHLYADPNGHRRAKEAGLRSHGSPGLR